MPAIAIPTAGAPILDTWGADVANALNRLKPVHMTADAERNLTAAAALGELSVPMVAGRVYLGRIHGTYKTGGTNQGLRVGWTTEDGGATTGAHLFASIVGSSATAESRFRLTQEDSLVGRTSVDQQNTKRAFWLDYTFICSASGTFVPTFARGGNSSANPGITIFAGTGGLWIESA